VRFHTHQSNRSSIMRALLSSYLLQSAAGEDGTSLMQRRFVKQHQHQQAGQKAEWDPLGWVVDQWNGVWEDDQAPVYSDADSAPADPEHICGTWTVWSECSQQCGGGLETRTYNYEDGAKCGESCPHGDGDKQQRECNTAPCVVDCEGEWGEYTSCSATCGGGVQSKMFTVTTPALHGGKQCAQAHGAMEDAPCSTQQCEKNCQGHWEDWSECSNGVERSDGLVCGPDGSQHRGFIVTQEHTTGGCGCSAAFWADLTTEVDVDASSTDTRECQLQCCPENCEGSWGAWGNCEGPNMKKLGLATPTYGYTGAGDMENCCGGGTKARNFSVTKDLVCGGEQCQADNGQVDTTTCCEAPCPVDCVGDWGEPGECCSTCGGGQHERIFMVTQVALHGGKQCGHKHGAVKRETCNEDIPCPIDCEGYWSDYDECTEQCGPDGTQTRRWIVTVEAEHGGEKCSERDQIELQSCDPEPDPCPIDAVCTWTEFGECSAECYDTQQPQPIIKTREWVEISEAQHGGAECKDTPPAYDLPEAFCHQPNCPINCIGSYGNYSECNAKMANELGGGCAGAYRCGRGTQTKEYVITQEALYGGIQCPHEDGHTSSKVCGDTPCPIDCEGNFSEWGNCCSDCGGGSMNRQYDISVEAQFGGCQCAHVEHTEHKSCNTHECPIDCEGAWGEYGTCSQTCTDCRNDGAVGIKSSTFTVSVPAQFGGKECPHTDGETRDLTCHEECCAEDCEGQWSDFGDCSKSCGNGVAERKYTVTHNAAHGGKQCPYCDKASHTTACNNTSPCAIDCQGAFLDWSKCDAPCGGGERTRYFIQSVQAQHGGRECEHRQFEAVHETCNPEACERNCIGASMGGWDTCDARCSGGKKRRSYTVFQAAAGGGAECTWPPGGLSTGLRASDGDVEEADCNMHDCPVGYVCPPQQTCKYTNGLIQKR